MTTAQLLPNKSLPALIELMDLLQKALSEQIHYATTSGTTSGLRHVTTRLVKDIDTFKKNFDFCYQNTKDGTEYQQLEILAKKLAKADDLIYQANQILEPLL